MLDGSHDFVHNAIRLTLNKLQKSDVKNKTMYLDIMFEKTVVKISLLNFSTELLELFVGVNFTTNIYLLHEKQKSWADFPLVQKFLSIPNSTAFWY